jgi:hypothetical protein
MSNRRRLNPYRSRQRYKRQAAVKALSVRVDLFNGFLDAMHRTGDIKWLRRLAELRALAQLIFDGLFPSVPDLVSTGELEVRDLSTDPRHTNFAITHRGRPLVTGFKTQPLAWFYVKKYLCTPATLTLDQHRRGRVQPQRLRDRPEELGHSLMPQRPSCSASMRRGGSRPISPSCRTCAERLINKKGAANSRPPASRVVTCSSAALTPFKRSLAKRSRSGRL